MNARQRRIRRRAADRHEAEWLDRWPAPEDHWGRPRRPEGPASCYRCGAGIAAGLMFIGETEDGEPLRICDGCNDRTFLDDEEDLW